MKPRTHNTLQTLYPSLSGKKAALTSTPGMFFAWQPKGGLGGKKIV
jgi:hypothetical protein